MDDWEDLYREAVLETDWSKMEERINAAESTLTSLNHGGTPEENQRIKDALSKLNVMRRDLAAWNAKHRA